LVWALGVYFSLAIGAGDFFGAYLARRAQPISVVITFMTVGGLAAAALMIVVPSEFIWRDVGFGAVSGLNIGLALVLMYHGMAVSSAAVVSPVTAVITALVPLSWDVATGASLSSGVILGIAVALVGLVITTFSPELGDKALAGVRWGLLAGLFFGLSLTFIGQANSDAGAWTTISQRSVAAIVLAGIAAYRTVPFFVPRSEYKQGLAGGVLTGTAVVAFVAGAQRGSLSEITITGSMFPAVTAVLAAVFEKHPLRWWQMIGIGLVIFGVVLIGIA